MVNELLCYALQAYWIVLIVRIILSWTTQVWSPPPSLTPIVRVVYDLTEPVMKIFRGIIPPVGGLDLSPILLFVILNIVIGVVCVG